MKICLIVVDAFGIGAAPDAAAFGDEGADTYRHVVEKTGLRLPNLAALGLNNIDGVPFPGVSAPAGYYGRLGELSQGKDTTTGHWEIAGLTLDKPFPTYPHGFPKGLIAEFERRIGGKVLYNGVASGTEIVRRLGEESRVTRRPIVYTSADSVFQVAAHVEAVSLARLYEICEIARELLVGEHAVARVIARPFAGKEGSFVRTSDRRDFSLPPFAPTILDRLGEGGHLTYAIGKIEDIFAGRGIARSVHTRGNTEGISATLAALCEDFSGLIFANLVDTDMLYGHRRDPEGYARALAEIDAAVPRLIQALAPEDALIFTGDHGCDPTFRGTDHTREYVPCVMAGNVEPGNFGTKMGFGFISDYIAGKFQLQE